MIDPNTLMLACAIVLACMFIGYLILGDDAEDGSRKYHGQFDDDDRAQ